MVCPELVEVKDGLLASGDKVIMKARDPSLFPEYIQEFFNNKGVVQKKEIDVGLDYVKIITQDRRAVFNSELFKYVKELGSINYYLSRVSIPGEYPCYPLFAEYKYGWCVLAPLEV